jgi:hypothetical protein
MISLSYFTPQNLIVQVLIQYSNIKFKWTQFWNNAYNTNILFKNIVDYFCYTKLYIKSKFYNKSIEPFSDQWIGMGTLLRDSNNDDVNKIFYYENYKSNLDLSEEEITSHFSGISNLSNQLFEGEIELLIIFKNNDKYLFRTFRRDSDKELFYSTNPSNVKFLTIEYTHPKMEKSIYLDFDKNIYLEENHILSSSFVRRFLGYQELPYHFDMDYKLKIMDNNINNFDIGSEEFIVLKKDEYKIIKS